MVLLHGDLRDPVSQMNLLSCSGGTGYKRRLQEIQQMEERAATLAEQAAAAEGLEGSVDEVVAR